MRDHLRTLVISAAFCGCAMFFATGTIGRTAERGSTDPKLTAAIVGNRALQAQCGGCIRKVEWIGSSYPRVTVDATAWRRLARSKQTAFARRALAAASAVYLLEWAADDIYQRAFIVDRAGTALMSFEP